MDKKSKYTNVFQTVFTGGMAYVISYITSLFLTAYITARMGTESFGYVSLIKQFAQYAYIFMHSLYTFSIRYITVEYYHNDSEKVKTYFSSVFYGGVGLSLIVVIATLLSYFNIDRIIVIPKEYLIDVKILFLLIFADFFVNAWFYVFNSVVYIKHKLPTMGAINCLAFLLQAFFLLVAYSNMQPRLYYVGIGMLIATATNTAAIIVMHTRYLPCVRITRKYFDFKAVKLLIINGIWGSINSIGDILNHGLDLLFCNLLLSPLDMGELAIAKLIQAAFQHVYGIINKSFHSIFLKDYSEKDRGLLLGDLKAAMKISGMVGNLGVALFVALGVNFYQLWLPNQNLNKVYLLTILTILVNIPNGPMQPLYYIYTLTVKKMVPSFVTVAGGALNAIGMVILIRHTSLGVFAVALTTLIVMMVVNFVTNPLYMAHVLEIPPSTFYPSIIRNIVSELLMVVIFKAIMVVLDPTGWIGLIFCAIFLAFLGILLHLVVVNTPDELRAIVLQLKKVKK